MNYKTKLSQLRESCVLVKTPNDAQAFLAAEISKNFKESDLVFIAENDAEMDLLQKQLQFFSPHLEILTFPAWDCLPYDRSSPKQLILSSRIKTLYKLATRKEGQRFFIITSINSFLQKTVAPSQIKNLGLYLQVGTKIALTQISEVLVSKGYCREACANNVGEFAVRGGIVDVVMQSAIDLIGYRIDFFGDVIESIKVFDPITQITQEAVKALEILPTSEVILGQKTVENFRKKYRQDFGASIDDQLYGAISEMRTYSGMEHWLPFFYEENLVGMQDYLINPTIFLNDKIFTSAKKREELVSEYYQARVAERKIRDGAIYNPIAPELLYFSADELQKNLEKNTLIRFNQFEVLEKNSRILDLEFKPVPDFALAGRTNQRDPIDLMKEFFSRPRDKHGVTNEREPHPSIPLTNASSALVTPSSPLANSPSSLSPLVTPSNDGVYIACLSESFRERIVKILPDYQIKCPTIVLPMHFGFYTSDFAIIGEQAIFGEKVLRKKNNKAASQRLIEEGLSIQLDELVVHRDHGIGRFKGINLVSAGGLKIDMIKIEYGSNDILFVPVDDINLISRYGADNPLIQLDRLGAAAWKNRKEKVRTRIKVAAEELLKIAAARHLKKAPIFAPDQHFYDEFKAKFGFVETEDQAQAIAEVEEDLSKGSPMDRLICGDVGFGKTEVALRAAAIVAGSNFIAREGTPHPSPLPQGERGQTDLVLTPSPLVGEGWGEGYPNLTNLAKNLRKNNSEAESKLWKALQNRQINNCKFRRQHQINNFIVDFVCLEKNLIIELDGGQHGLEEAQEYDANRTRSLEEQGFRVLRFWNNEVFQNFEGVCEAIYNEVLLDSSSLPLTPTLSHKGRGSYSDNGMRGSESDNKMGAGFLDEDAEFNYFGHQVAIVAPTTLLVRQHYKNFSKRFAETDVKIAQLSRLVSVAEAKKIRQELESGHVQIVIGTHALLQKTIKFKNLGLVIIDEEQHFGVAQKERLKELRNEVHVLTLSATPIPRTLQMSLTGVKDLSLIATPPIDRLAVRNFVMPYDSVIVREAVLREHNRGGRIFFVVPRVSDVNEMEARLKILLPEIKIAHGHGQMSPVELDKIMNDFSDGKIDMLVSTTIVESGIDISEANTIIIYKPEMFGLAQLYQLRGRVGRGKIRAYCYFMFDNRKKISEDSRKKLEIMQNLDSLGIGFSVASHDMDIRGSGNLLGDEQSGHVRETGVELYQQMLLETIADLKNNPQHLQNNENAKIEIDFSAQIKLGISLLIPENYMQDLGLRMSFYKKIAAISNDEDQEKLTDEMNDRFGKIPQEIFNLMEIAKLKSLCKKLAVEKLEANSEGLIISFKDNQFKAPDKLLQLIFSSKNRIKLHTGQKVLFLCDVKSTELKISSAQNILNQLQKLL
jgi:transcription-repair coupling factor (superfamily II helicase)/very-short-patch-repair endonuclease